MSNSLKVPSDGLSDDNGQPNKSWVNHFNQNASKMNAIATVGATTSPVATDLPTALILLAELQAKFAALNTAANK